MSRLVPIGNGDTLTLLPETILGRSPRSDIVLDDPCVSGTHARLRWARTGWVVRDLGSSNGTWIDGEKLQPGQDHPLRASMELALGSARCRWRLESEGPPPPQATSHPGTAVGSAGRLVLPPVGEEQLVIYEEAGSWVSEDLVSGAVVPVSSGDIVLAGGERWRLHLVGAEPVTLQDAAPGPHLSELSLYIRSRRGDEYVEIRASDGKTEIELGEYACYAVVLFLARARLEDDAAGLLPAESGWRMQEEVLEALKIRRLHLFTQTRRARIYFSEAGVLGASGLFERRNTSGEIRLGIGRLLVDDGRP